MDPRPIRPRASRRPAARLRSIAFLTCAWAALGHAPAAQDGPNAAAPPPGSGALPQAIHQQLSVACFNDCWALIDKEEKSAEDHENMLLLAYASLWHWKQRTDCTPVNLSVGYWQVSRVHALEGQSRMARIFGRRCLAIGQEHELAPFYLGYAHEALARAALLSDNDAAAREHLGHARAELARVTDAEERALLEADLRALEARLDPARSAE